MTIIKKIASGFAVALAVVGVKATLLYWTTTMLVEASETMSRTHQVLDCVQNVYALVKDQQRGHRGFLLTGEKSFLEPWENAARKLPEAQAELGKWLKTEAAAEGSEGKEKLVLLAELEQELKARKIREAYLIGMAQKGAIADPYREFKQVLEDVEPRLEPDAIDSLLKTYGNLVQGQKTGLDAARALIREGKGVRLLDRLGDTCEQIEKIERESLRARRAAVQDGVLLLKLTLVFGTAIALAVVALFALAIIRSINRTVSNGVSKLATVGAQIQASAAQQAAGAQEQAAAVAQTVTTVNEVSQTAEQSTQRARAVGDTAQRTLEIGKTGRKTVDDSLQAMGAVKDKVETTAQNILMLAEQAQAIGDIIATVNDIAEQTNILALNAAIEASRAGEQGRGFSVVAGEVKALADQSKKATAQIRQILGEIQKATHTAVLSTEEVTKGVASAIKVGDQAGETIKTLSEALTDMVRTVTQIAASVGQQATGMAQIHQAMKNIDTAARQNTVASQQATQAAENLNAVGVELARFIGK